jgi:hypothetical protein
MIIVAPAPLSPTTVASFAGVQALGLPTTVAGLKGLQGAIPSVV